MTRWLKFNFFIRIETICKSQNMENNLSLFIEQHPDWNLEISLYYYGWEMEYGEDFIMDVACSEEDAEARVNFYQSRGYQLVDNNYFGIGFTIVGIAQCYRKSNNPNIKKNE